MMNCARTAGNDRSAEMPILWEKSRHRLWRRDVPDAPPKMRGGIIA
jgi:hypothetical protein